MTSSTSRRWEALDALRGLSIIGMLMNTTPGAWDHSYPWLIHAKWAGLSPIDLVAPIFLFCIGAAIPLSMDARLRKGVTKSAQLGRIWQRAGILVLIGLFLDVFPTFDFAHMRIPGVLQRIGLSYGLIASFFLLISASDALHRAKITALTATGMLLAYWALLALVPVPGFGAPRFDPMGSWPAYIDRMVFGVDHMFKYWPVDGKVIFDPDGLVTLFPVCLNVLAGACVSSLFSGRTRRTTAILWLAGSGIALAAIALLISGICPIIKNIWTPSFALISIGAALFSLAAVQGTVLYPIGKTLLFPAEVYGSNALLAYMIAGLLPPFIDHSWIASALGPISIRYFIYSTFSQHMSPELASLLFSLLVITVLYGVLWACYKKGWFLKL